ncbi:MAG: hypothetical protein HC857_15175, partial [Synechococcales cyanobacterium RU_4_20]|nr:hypothetical protein [Synechococcales cyanobacterium RU_4_20]
MAIFDADQRNYLYVLEAARVGIHKSILAALYAVHNSAIQNPACSDALGDADAQDSSRTAPQPHDALPEEEVALQRAAAQREAADRDQSSLGLVVYGRVSANQIDSLEGQVQVAATTIRSLTDQLINKKTSPLELWDGEAGAMG